MKLLCPFKRSYGSISAGRRSTTKLFFWFVWYFLLARHIIRNTSNRSFSKELRNQFFRNESINDPRHSHSGPPIFEKLWRARSPLYRSRFLRPRYHFAAFFEIYKIYIPSHRSKLKISTKIRMKICWFFRKKSTFFIKFIVFRTGFDENSLEFQHFFRNLWRIFEISLILTHSEWGGCEKWRNNFRENTDFSS